MAGELVFNYFKDGIIGHTSVTLVGQGTSISLSSSADIAGIPLGIYSTRHESFRKWSSIHVIEKKVVVDDIQFAAVKSYFEVVRESRSDYGWISGTNCLDFVQNIWDLGGGEGTFSSLYTHTELAGPLSGAVLIWRETGTSRASPLTLAQEGGYRSKVDGDFGMSGGIVLFATLLVIGVLACPWQRVRNKIRSRRAARA